MNTSFSLSLLRYSLPTFAALALFCLGRPSSAMEPFLPLPTDVAESLIPWHVDDSIRDVASSPSGSLNDIESRMKAGHIYRDHDRVTWAHETTHGLNSKLRMRHGGTGKVNAFYCLDGRYVVFQEPNFTVNQVAANVPKSLHGMSFSLYMRQGAWNHEPLYILDEWVSYTNGSQVRYELGLTNRGESVQQMMEFAVYALTLQKMLPEDYPQKEELTNFIRWQLARSMEVYELNATLGGVDRAASYVKLIQNELNGEEDAAEPIFELEVADLILTPGFPTQP